MPKKVLRVRMFAGPNGSGKSTLIKRLREKINFEIYLNADDIQLEIKRKNYIDLKDYSLQLTNADWIQYINSAPGLLSRIQDNLSISVKIENNILVVKTQEQLSYIAACICDFLREMLFLHKKSFTFETVMSHVSKVDFMKKLQQSGFFVLCCHRIS